MPDVATEHRDRPGRAQGQRRLGGAGGDQSPAELETLGDERFRLRPLLVRAVRRGSVDSCAGLGQVHLDQVRTGGERPGQLLALGVHQHAMSAGARGADEPGVEPGRGAGRGRPGHHRPFTWRRGPAGGEREQAFFVGGCHRRSALEEARDAAVVRQHHRRDARLPLRGHRGEGEALVAGELVDHLADASGREADQRAVAAQGEGGAQHVRSLAPCLGAQHPAPRQATGAQTVRREHVVQCEIGADDEGHGVRLIA